MLALAGHGGARLAVRAVPIQFTTAGARAGAGAGARALGLAAARLSPSNLSMSSIARAAELCPCRRHPSAPQPRPSPPRPPPVAMPSSMSALKSLRVFFVANSGLRPRWSSRSGASRAPFGVCAFVPGREYYAEGRPSASQERSGAPHEQDQRLQFPRPPTIQWEKDLANAVRLIGTVGRDVDLRYLDSGIVLATSVLAVKKSGHNSWFEIELWDELAQIAAHHVKKGEQIFVKGRIVVDKWVKDDLRYSAPKVLVRDFCFVGPYDSRRQQYDQSSGAQQQNMNVEVGSNNPTPSTASSQPSWNQYALANSSSQGATAQRERFKNQDDMISTEKRWQEYFADPTQWWDNRNNKRNPKAPDFKHKSTQEALWLKSWSNPPWVSQQMAILEERKAQHAGDVADFQHGFQEKNLSSFRDSDLLY